MRKRWVSLVSALMVLALLAGCGSRPAARPAPGGNASGKTYRVGLVVKNSVNPHWKLVQMGAAKFASEVGDLQITNLAPTKPESIEESVRIVEDQVAKYKAGQLDALAFVPVDYKAMVPAIEKANAAGLPIINYCNELTAGGDYESFVGINHEQLAYDIGTWLAKKLNGKGKVIILEGVPGSITAQDRQAGYMRALKENPGIEIIASQPANYARATAMQVMENLLQQHKQFDAVIAANDEMALGAIRALEAAGRLKGVYVTGVDGIDDALKAIEEGKLSVTADYRGYDLGYETAKATYEFLTGKTLEKRIIMQYQLIEGDNIKSFMEKIKAQGQM